MNPLPLPRFLRPVHVSARSTAARVRGAIGIGLIVSLIVPVQAGDLLRGGAPAGVPSAPAGAPAAGQTPPAATLPRAQDSLARTTAAIASVRAMQSSARAAAIAGPNNLGLNPNRPGLQLPNVPNGLATNGLQIAPAVPRNLDQPTVGENPTLWTGARLPVQTTESGQTNVTIRQTAQQSLLTWSTFNIGKETTLTFDQSAGGANQTQWVSFNRILDPSGAPSQILGSIQAGGQVFVLNQNGILFGGSSQVRVHTLLASTLPINDNLVSRGLLNNPDAQFLFSQRTVPALAGGVSPAFVPPPVTNPTGRNGDVVVNAGAQLSSATASDGVGGRISLIGANVRNAGSISSPDGQTILAAGLQVGLSAHSTTDPSLRGLDTFVGATDAFSGSVTNTGLIEVARGNLTMAGASLAQLGAVESTTSVSLNGRIDLIASFGAVRAAVNGVLSLVPTRAGQVTLGPDSVTRVVPELASTDRVVGNRLALSSLVNVQAQSVYLAPNSTLLAPGANLPSDTTRPALGLDGRALEAGISLSVGSWLAGGSGSSVFVRTDGQIYLDRGALIDAAGTRGAAALVTDNIITADLRGPELADSPLQRDGALRGQSVQIDIRQTGTFDGRAWVGTPLADVSGFVNLVQRTVGVLTTAGGTVALNAGGSVVLQPGASIDVSGGSTAFAGGLVQTTKVIAGNRIFDISEATPERRYNGIYNGFNQISERYGLIQNFTSTLVTAPQFEPGYIQGADGGALTIRAPAMALDGELRGGVTTGPRQQIAPPNRSSLALVFNTQQSVAPGFFVAPPLVPPTVEFREGATRPPADPFQLDQDGRPLALRLDRQRQVRLAPSLLGTSGFGRLTVNNTDGNIIVPADVRFEAPAGGVLSLAGANVGIFGQVSIPGGSLTFEAFNLSPAGLLVLQNSSGAVTPDPDPARGNFTLGAGASVSTAGSVLDNRFTGVPDVTIPAVRPGGSVTIRAYNANLVESSRIDVSGGTTISSLGRASYGAGGTISISAGNDPGVASILGGRLVLGATLTGFSGGTGGTLSILAPRIQVGGVTPALADPFLLQLTPAFFRQGGFSRYALTGLGAVLDPATTTFLPAVVIGPGTALAPVTVSRLANTDGPALEFTDLLQPEGIRPPASVSFAAPGVTGAFLLAGQLVLRGDLLFGEGASIRTDARASVGLSGNTVDVLGSISAPGGSISISGAGNSLPLFGPAAPTALTTTHLGPNASLSTRGSVLLLPNALGQRTGSVLAGGSISLSGNIAAEAGAVLDVSGAAGVLDLAPGFTSSAASVDPSGTQLVATTVESNAGTITLSGGQQLFSDATLRGFAGGPSAQGGTLNVSSSRFVPLGGDTLTALNETLVIRQSGRTIPVPFYGPGQSAIGRPVLLAGEFVARSVGNFVVDSFTNSGLASLALNGTIAFAGPVQIRADRSITAASGGVLFADNAVALNAPYVRLGTAFAPPLSAAQQAQQTSVFQEGGDPFFIPPVPGQGQFRVTADLVDFGNLSLQRVGLLEVAAGNGDVRGNGTVNLVGRIAIQAGQIYPPTGTRFNLVAYDRIDGAFSSFGSVEITGGGARGLPLSAGGQLNLYASLISQGGVLRAPIGSINLGTSLTGAAGRDLLSGLAFPTTRTLALLPGSVTSVSAVDPRTGLGLVIPYGTVVNGVTWLDPTGTDITTSGLPTKSLSLSAINLTNQPGATTDLTGGGDLYAYRFAPGTGGSRDVLATTTSFAVLPGYDAGYAPYAPDYGTAPAPGERVFLEASPGLPAGFYTLLPARYALLAGAFLVTPRSGGTPSVSSVQPDGSSVVAGYRSNGLNRAQTGRPLLAVFEVAPAAVVRTRANYVDSFANAFFAASATARGVVPPRLPRDAGQLSFAALQTLTVQGNLRAAAPTGALGAVVDLATPADIFIGGAGSVAPAGSLALDAATLSAFGAESLLIGGFRTATDDGSAVTVLSRNVTVDNAGAALVGADITLVASGRLSFAAGAEIEQTRALSGTAETFLLPSSGVAFRVSSDRNAAIERSNVVTTAGPILTIGAGARLSGAALIVDSTAGATLDPTASLSGEASSLRSGRLTLALAGSGLPGPGAGLVLTSGILSGLLSGAESLSFLSYSEIDVLGSGTVGGSGLARLEVRAGQIRALGAGEVIFAARELQLGNSAGSAPVAGSAATLQGRLSLNAQTIRVGFEQTDLARNNALTIDGFAEVRLNAVDAILIAGRGGSNPGLFVTGALDLQAPVVAALTGAEQSIRAAGPLVLRSASGGATVASGLGARLELGGSTVTLGSRVSLPSGELTVRAASGDLTVSGSLEVAGTERRFNDAVRTTVGGNVQLLATAGSVELTASSRLDLSAPAGTEAGFLSIGAPAGTFSSAGTLRGAQFSLDVGMLARTADLQTRLRDGGFTTAVGIRVRSGDVALEGNSVTRDFRLAVDTGALAATGRIDASGPVGGRIELSANTSLTLAGTLSVAGAALDAAGRGGFIFLGTTGGRLTLNPAATLDLAVASGGGVLHLRAPQTADGDRLALAPIRGSIRGAREIVVEGFAVTDAATTTPTSLESLQPAALAGAAAFMTGAEAIRLRLAAGDTALAGLLRIRPGVEIRNSLGDLTLNQDWDLSTARYGATRGVVDPATGLPILGLDGTPLAVGAEPGILTLRAAGSITLLGSLTDGFGDGTGQVPTAGIFANARWRSELLPLFADGTSQDSWSLRLTAGADVTAADFRAIRALSELAGEAGTISLGRDGGQNITFNPGADATTSPLLNGLFQVIRTGTGSIELTAGRDVRLLNPFASIYTAGARTTDVTLGGRFDLPILDANGGARFLGALQQSPDIYRAQYSSGGGNVVVSAQQDIRRLTRDQNGVLIDDSSREMPTNWLYRRGYVDPATGTFGIANFGDVASTSWWVDFSNFFQGVGALGGGNVSLLAGRDIRNVEGVIPTNLRTTGRTTAGGRVTPAQAEVVELGGGNLLVRAGRDLDAGIYYVERGAMRLSAGGEIRTNATRTPSLGTISGLPEDIFDARAWLPTTLFLGNSTASVTARGDILLGPVSNPFLLPQGYSNTFWYKTYFSTFGAASAVSVQSSGGDITFRTAATPFSSGAGSSLPLLFLWYRDVLLQPVNAALFSVSSYQPWLRLDETSLDPFLTASTLLPGTFKATALNGDINLVGQFNFSPSAAGTLELLAQGNIFGLQPSGVVTLGTGPLLAWSSSRLNVSDSDPAQLPSIRTPSAFQATAGTLLAQAAVTGTGFLDAVDGAFAESGATTGANATLDAQQARHDPTLLHRNDPEPLRLYALGGDISGFTLFSPKKTALIAGRDIADIALFVQNVGVADISTVAAGRDITLFNSSSALQAAARAVGNLLNQGEVPQPGDVQLGGAGSLQVLAGRNLDLGPSAARGDGTGLGISSIGDTRNPALPATGASLYIGAGIGAARSLDESLLRFDQFEKNFLDPATASTRAPRYLAEIAPLLGLESTAPTSQLFAAYQALTKPLRDQVALIAFYAALRNAGRDRVNPDSPDFGTYAAGEAAIAALFPGEAWNGSVSLATRQIRTAVGGSIEIFAPGGGLLVGRDVPSANAADEGILTQGGGDINLFTRNSVDVGTSRIFTLRGGNVIIWSTVGDIAAGSSSQTILAAPPTRVLIDFQSAAVETDLAGLATGGGIGVLATVAGVAPSNVDLIAPAGTVDAGDAGIRVSGNLNISAVQVVNSANIAAGGSSSGVPSVAAPNLGALTAASTTAAATSSGPTSAARENAAAAAAGNQDLPSVISVEVIGYGGGGEPTEESEEDRRRRQTAWNR